MGIRYEYVYSCSECKSAIYYALSRRHNFQTLTPQNPQKHYNIRVFVWCDHVVLVCPYSSPFPKDKMFYWAQHEVNVLRGSGSVDKASDSHWTNASSNPRGAHFWYYTRSTRFSQILFEYFCYVYTIKYTCTSKYVELMTLNRAVYN